MRAAMKFGLGAWCCLLITYVAASGRQEVAVDFDRNIDFARLATYSWSSGGGAAANPLIDQQIRASIDGQLAAKGLRRVEQGGQLSVLYFAAVEKDIQVATANWVSTGNWMTQARTGFSVKSQTWDVETGTLLVCLFDASGKNLLWRGTARAALDERSRNRNVMEAMKEDARKTEKIIRKSVEKMFRQYPRVKAA